MTPKLTFIDVCEFLKEDDRNLSMMRISSWELH